jgi:hypothetical protein
MIAKMASTRRPSYASAIALPRNVSFGNKWSGNPVLLPDSDF